MAGIDTTVAGTYVIHYNVSDAAGNHAAEVTRTVIIAVPDTTVPVITLNGDAATTVTVGVTYTDAGATAADDADGTVKVTSAITNAAGETVTAVDTASEGTYTITYTAKDAAGNTAKATRTVTVTKTLFDDRIQVSTTKNKLVGGAAEYTIVSAGKYNYMNTSYFCEANITGNSNLKIMSCYGNYDAGEWKMQTPTSQAAAAQAYFDKTPGYENYKVVGIINGDFFNMSTGEPQGTLVMNGKVCHNSGGEPYFAIRKDGTPVIRDSSVPLDDCTSAVGGNDIILKDGAIESGLKDSTDPYTGIMYSRAAIGIKQDGTVVTMCTRGFVIPDSYGLTYYEVAAYLKSMGCVNALMLDCGGSAEWCSMYEGTNELKVRNNPSDGYERAISSSIIIVSTAARNGEFDHTVITPSAAVYTPNSTVAFTATGVDSAGGAAKIPQEATWSLADNSYGTIDSQGVFTSNGKIGDVTVQLYYDNAVVGKSTITIAAPDSISFVSPAISIGRGKESNLGILVRYKGQKVNYHAGDLIWSLSDNSMGTVNTDTNIFTASADLTVSGTITVTSKYDKSVCGSVAVTVGQDPTMAMDFEGHANADGTVTDAYTYWGADSTGKIVGRETGGTYLTQPTGMLTTLFYNRGGNESAQIVSRADGYPVHKGTYALKINYDMSKAIGTEGANVGFTQDYLIPGNPTALGLWVYVPHNTPNLWLRLQLSTVDGTGKITGTTQYDFTKECKMAFAENGTYGGLSNVEPGSWQFLTADLSKSAGSRFMIPAGQTIRVMWTSSTTPLAPNQYNSRTDITNSCGIYLPDGRKISQADCAGSIYVDDLMFIYGSINEDAKAPSVTTFTANNGNISDDMTFNTDTISFKAMFKDENDVVNNVQASGIDFNNVYMYVDGQRMQNAVVDKGGMIELDGVKFANGEHSVKLLVCDKNGNEKNITYRFIVNDANSKATTVQLVSRQKNAVLDKSVDLDVVSSNVSNVKSMTMTLQIDSKYQDKYTITAGDGFSIDKGSIVYDKIHNTVKFTANRSAGAGSTGNGTIATISFAISTTTAEGSCFVYSVDAGSLTYFSPEGIQPSFASLNYELPVTAPYTISSDVIVVGMSGNYFYVKDASGSAVSGLTVCFSDGSIIGTTDSYGKVAVPASIENAVTPFTVYAKDSNGNISFSYTGQSYAAGGNTDGSPVHILNNAASDGSTARNLSWMSNPVYSHNVAEVQISDSEANIGSGTTCSGTSKLMTFKGSSSASENYAARINGVTITGLTPGATYYYRVGDGVTWSTVNSFTMPSANNDTNMFILGDVQAKDETNIKTILSTLQNSGINYNLGVQTGDAVDLASLYSDWTDTLGLMDSFKNNQVMLHTVGNHEQTGEAGGDITSAVYNLANPSYYSVRYGRVYVATISFMNSMSDYEKALNWLVEDANKSDAPYKILVMHQPAYYTNMTEPSNEQLHELLPAYAEKAGINIVFAGHDHSYARTQEINGVTYYICGTSGEKAYPVTNNPDFDFVMATDNFTAIYLTVNATEKAITVTTYDLVNGVPTVIDTYTKSK